MAKVKPPSPKDRSNLATAEAAIKQGDYGRAIGLLIPLQKKHPKDPSIAYLLGGCLVNFGDDIAAERVLRKALQLKPDNADAMAYLARIRMHQSRFKEGLRLADKALRARAECSRALAAKADILTMQGEDEQVYELLNEALARGTADGPLVVSYGEACRRLGHIEQGIDAMQAAVEADTDAAAIRARIFFTLGALYEKAGRYDEAFRAYERGNELRPSDYMPAEFERSVDRVTGTWTAEALAACSQSSSPCDHLVFIVGMPRSGTTLVEQILASHSQVFGAGERFDLEREVRKLLENFSASGVFIVEMIERLDERTVRSISRSYLDATGKLDRRAMRFTDKTPTNFLHLGLINRLFPQARVIHCRRDPMDTCVSIFSKNFAGDNPFAYDLGHIGHFYRQYERLMDHWKQVVSVPIMEITYEELVGDQEGVSRRMVEFLDLEWEDACLRFFENDRVALTASNEQVRQPIYRTSAGRHHRFAGHLGPLREALEE